jgi:hypothetical protein
VKKVGARLPETKRGEQRRGEERRERRMDL